MAIHFNQNNKLNLYHCDRCGKSTEVVTVITKNSITGERYVCRECVDKSSFLGLNALCEKYAWNDEVLNPQM